MKRLGLVVLSAFLMFAPASFAEEPDRESVAAKQDAVACLPELMGADSFVAEIWDSRWTADEKLRRARLHFALKEHRYKLIEVPDVARDSALPTMIRSHGDLLRRLGNAFYRVEKIPEGFDVRCVTDGDAVVVTAKRSEIEPGARAGLLTRVNLRLHAGRLLIRAEFEFHELGKVVHEDFAYEKCGDRYRLDGVTVRGPGDAQVERMTIDWVHLAKIWLPARVERVVGERDQRREFLSEWQILYQSVNGEAVVPTLPPTPEATVLDFFDAANRGDKGLLAKCFSEKAPREFQPIIKRELTAEQLAELKAAFGGGKIVYVERVKHPDHAIVHITYQRGGAQAKEKLEMRRIDGEWKILDF